MLIGKRLGLLCFFIFLRGTKIGNGIKPKFLYVAKDSGLDQSR